jgi:hypothetical protein
VGTEKKKKIDEEGSGAVGRSLGGGAREELLGKRGAIFEIKKNRSIGEEGSGRALCGGVKSCRSRGATRFCVF